MKRVFLFALMAVIIGISCKNEGKKTESAEAVTEVSLNDLLANAGDYVGQTVKVTGLVQHVCHESGKRMFILDKTPDTRIRIDVGENMAPFAIELEGSNVEVVGEVVELRIDETYLQQWEEELKTDEKLAEDKKVHTGGEGEGEGTGHEDHSQMGEAADQGTHTAAEEQIAKYRQQIADSGTDHLSFYSITCKEYKEITE